MAAVVTVVIVLRAVLSRMKNRKQAEMAAAAKAKKASAPPWPQGVPNLYPGLAADKLCHFLDKEEYLRIRAMHRVIVTPFYDEKSSQEEKYFGVGLQKLLTRDLRLHREISVLGPEDSPDIPLSQIDVSKLKNSVLIGGTVRFKDERYHGLFQVFDGEPGPLIDVSAEDFQQFLLDSARGLLSALGLEADATLLSQWQTGRPGKAQDLVSLGELEEMPYESADRKNGPKFTKAMEMYRANPNFILPLHAPSDETEISLDDYLQAFARDPYDVQLQFRMHNKLWTGSKGELAAFQYLRRAIELSPGHGKAHMAAANAAPAEADLLYHVELGYQLLPGNSFAVGNYLAYLFRKNLVPPDLSVAYEGVKLDPRNITPYWQGIMLLKRANHLSEALGLAMQLKKVVTPPLAERTIYCIHQNPQRAAQWKAGKYNPLEDVEKEIAELQTKLAGAGEISN